MVRFNRLCALYAAAALMFAGALAAPAHAARDRYLLVGDYTTHDILRYDLRDGTFVDTFVDGESWRGLLFGPSAMTLGPDGDLYVATGHRGSTSDDRDLRIYRFDASSGKSKGVFGSLSVRRGGIYGLGFGPDGDLYAAEGTYNTVYRFDGSTGASKGVFASLPATGGRSFRDLAWGPDGHLYVAELWTGLVARFDGRTGSLIDHVGSARTDVSHDLAFAPNGQLYVTQYFGGGIDIYDPTTNTFVKSLATPHEANDVQFDSRGGLYVSALFSNAIDTFRPGPDGTVLPGGRLFASGTPMSNAHDMVLVPVPEPTTSAMMGIGIIAVLWLGGRKVTRATGRTLSS
jgi:WD40 repeat protein